MARYVLIYLFALSCTLAVGAGEPAGSGAKRDHWSFRTVLRAEPPTVHDESWVRTPLDRFILKRLEKEAVRPSPEADKTTLLRRVYLDLIGLLPTPAEVDAFLADSAPDAYERVVDRLLASPQFGERWGRHWLDLARYADSNGFNIDAPRSIWKYRDWVIDSLNGNMPFDEFAIEQIAGDLLPSATLSQRVATGFHRNTLINQEGGIDVEQFRIESIVDRVNTTGAAFLGLTVGCAQCHNHKFDPFSQREYYQMFAFLNGCDEPELELPEPGQIEARATIRKRIAELQKQLAGDEAALAKRLLVWEKDLALDAVKELPASIQAILKLPDNGRTPDQIEKLRVFYGQLERNLDVAESFGAPLFVRLAATQTLQTRLAIEEEIASLKKREPKIITTLIVQERQKPRETHVLLGGDFLRKGDRVEPGTPNVLPPLTNDGKPPTRLDLARWLVDPKNPLTPRVAVNRMWQEYFGIGLVETENDFGTQGTPPSHPELLDWLASEFVTPTSPPSQGGEKGGWNIKAMHRLIVTSATYRQSSRTRPELRTLDPRNRLLARQARLRLDAEVVRDVCLCASGLLSTHIGGPSVFPPQPDGVFRFTQIPRDWTPSTGPDRYRRGMYTWFWRSSPHPALTVFDAPDSTTTCTRRNRSNTPLQALTMLNDQAAFEFAQALASRLVDADVKQDGSALRQAFRRCLCREPNDAELKRLEQLLHTMVELFESHPDEAAGLLPLPAPDVDAARFGAWLTVARVLLNLDEFVTRE